jgi:hypothetical protein
MLHFGKKLTPNNISTQEYLEILYFLPKMRDPITLFEDMGISQKYPIENEPPD